MLALTLGMNDPHTERTELSAVRIWPRACTASGLFRCASATASSTEIGRRVSCKADPAGCCATAPDNGSSAKTINVLNIFDSVTRGRGFPKGADTVAPDAARAVTPLLLRLARLELLLLPGRQDLEDLLVRRPPDGVELRLNGVHQGADLGAAGVEQRIHHTPLRFVQAEVVVHVHARSPVLATIAQYAIRGKTEHAAHEDGTKEEHQRLLFGTLHRFRNPVIGKS